MAREDIKIYDYCACLYPEGILSPKESFVYFNKDEISEVVFTGPQNDLETAFNEHLTEISKNPIIPKLVDQKIDNLLFFETEKDKTTVSEMRYCIEHINRLNDTINEAYTENDFFTESNATDLKIDYEKQYKELARNLFSQEKIEDILESGQMDFMSSAFIDYAEIQKQIDNYGFLPNDYVIIQGDGQQLETMRNYLEENSYKFADPGILNHKDYVFMIDSTNKVATYSLSEKILENSELPVKSLSKFLSQQEKQKKPLSERLNHASEKLNINKSSDKQVASKSYEKRDFLERM